ncbi:MAG: hypothetical protein VX589_18515, partial [Myxococcota bacterium]|nr:hypothetical protein [Myxococcota bacterium]
LDDGSIACWGSNFYGALGIAEQQLVGRRVEDMGEALSVVRLPNDAPAVQLALGDELTCALSTDGSVYCWGKNGVEGQAGLEQDDLAVAYAGSEHPAVRLGAEDKVLSVVAYNRHVCVHLGAEQVQCWGNNESGALGLGTPIPALGASPGDLAVGLSTMDLGRDCPRCANGLQCNANVQCASDLCIDGRCADASCDDGVQNGSETDIDCGGAECAKCLDGQKCSSNNDCQDSACILNTCSSCTDGIRAGHETDVDCGGSDCRPCAVDRACVLPRDCETNNCLPVDNQLVCLAPTCEDGVKNGLETDVDCGGIDCPGCADGDACEDAGDCASSSCDARVCASCDDGVLNQGESDLDCGGVFCAACADGARCTDGGDCTSGRCTIERCAVATCGDGIKNGLEGALDCGDFAAITALGVGENHACFIFGDGGIRCVGRNDKGQLGLNDGVTRGIDINGLGDALPQALPGLDRRFTEIDGGWQHTCALDETGAVFCWGDNTSGQIGRAALTSFGNAAGQLDEQFAPLNFPTADKAIQLAVGGAHSCALFKNGKVRCWGLGASGQLGSNSDAVISSTENLGFIQFRTNGWRVKQVVAGDRHTCVLHDDENGTILCFGRNEFGQLGTGTRSNQGDNESRRLTQGIYVKLQTQTPAIRLAAGRNHTCAVFANGEVRCWGNNSVGQLGIDNTDNIGSDFQAQPDGPQPVLLNENAMDIALGNDHGCAFLASGSVKCWGSNSDGQLGLGRDVPNLGDDLNDMALFSGPVVLPTGQAIKSIALGGAFSCARLTNGRPYCWGANRYGQLGLGDDVSRGRFSGDMGNGLDPTLIGANCPPCIVGQTCTLDRQCISLDCTENDRCGYDGCDDESGCPNCWDGVENGDETDVDCGGPTCEEALVCDPPRCDRCGLRQSCKVDNDCASGLCERDEDEEKGRCISCDDNEQNGTESDVDCGGICARSCEVGQGCRNGEDCISTVCGPDGLCMGL